MEGMFSYAQAAGERAMKVQEVILRAMAKKITWWQAAEIMGISDRQMRRWRERYEGFGFRGLFDRRRGKPSPKRVPVAVVEKVLELDREKYFDWNVRHFHEKLPEEHPVAISNRWVKGILQGAGMVAQGASAECIASGVRGGRYPGCCGTSTAVSIAGFKMSAGTTCGSFWTMPTVRSTRRSWWKRKRRFRCCQG
jgi:transposase